MRRDGWRSFAGAEQNIILVINDVEFGPSNARNNRRYRRALVMKMQPDPSASSFTSPSYFPQENGGVVSSKLIIYEAEELAKRGGAVSQVRTSMVTDTSRLRRNRGN